MKNKALKFIIVLFAILCAIQLISGIVLFIYKFGFSYEMLNEYFLGNEDKFILPKEFNGLLETSMFHFLAQMGVAFIIAHFVLFIKNKSKLLIASGYGVMIFALVDILAPYFIVYIDSFFIWFKFIGFIGFEICMFYILAYLLTSSIKTNK